MNKTTVPPISAKSLQRGATLIWFIFLLFAAIPTSRGGQIFGTWWLISVWMLTLLLLSLLAIRSQLDTPAVVVGSLTLAYLLGVTLVSLTTMPDARFSFARTVPVFGLVALSVLRFKSAPKVRSVTAILDCFMIVAIPWNLAIVVGNVAVKDFTAQYFNQYQESALFYSMLYNKPVLSFGIHSYAAFFYALLFFLCLQAWRATSSKRFAVYCLVLFGFTVFLASQSALVMAILMVLSGFGTLFEPIRDRVKATMRLALFPAILIVVSIALLLVWPLIASSWATAFSSDINGIQGRYGRLQEYYGANLDIINSSLGIGFNVLDNSSITYSDSGYIVYSTMGSIPFLAALFFLTVRFIRQNFDRGLGWTLIVTVLLFEGASTALLNYRFTLVMVFMAMAGRALSVREGRYETQL